MAMAGGALGAAGSALNKGMKSLGLKEKKHKDPYGQNQYQDPYDQNQHSPKSKNKGLGNAANMAQNIASTGILGSKAMMAAGAVGLAQQGPSQLKNNHGGVAGSVMNSGLMGHKGRMVAIATGMGQPQGHGGVTTQRVLGSGLMGNKGVVASMLMNGKKH